MEWKIPATSRNNLMEVYKECCFYGYNCNRTSYLLGRLDRPFSMPWNKAAVDLSDSSGRAHSSHFTILPFTSFYITRMVQFCQVWTTRFTTHRGLKHHTFCWPSDPGGSPPSGDMAKVKPGIGASMKGSWISGGVMDWARRAEILGDLRADRMQSMIFLKIRCGKFL